MYKDYLNNFNIGDKAIYTNINGEKFIGTVEILEPEHTGGTMWIRLENGDLKQVICDMSEKAKN